MDDGRAAVEKGESRRRIDRGEVIGGVVIVAIGVLLLLAQTMEQVGQYIPLIVGGLLLFAFVLTRNYGFLVPGGIVSGVGVGILLVAEDATGTRGPLFLVALGMGFVSISLIGLLFRVPEGRWWPLVPGAILIAVGTIALVGADVQPLLDYWPIVLVIVGAIVVAQALLRRDTV